MKKIVAILALASFLTGCTTDPYTGEPQLSNTLGGAGIGAGLGAGAGYLMGRASGMNSGTSALVGAGLGAVAGGGLGAYMDNQEARLRQHLQGTGVSVTRVGDRIILNMPSNITFATDQSAVLPSFYPTLDSVSLVLREYDRSIVDVFGHTDSQGSDSYNFQLSQRRAASVSDYLTGRGINPQRLNVQGFGKNQPIASNATEQGRAQNRRVEIQISPLRAG